MRRKRAFQPRLTLECTGYSGNARRQWCLRFMSSSGRIATCGLNAMDDDTPAAAWAEAQKFLCAINARPIS